MGQYTRSMGSLPMKQRLPKNKQKILDLLAGLWLPTKLAIIHCPGHWRIDTPAVRGKQRADQVAKEATEQTMDIPILTLLCRTARSPCESSLYPSWLVHDTALTKIMTAPMIRELVGDQQWKTHFSREADWSSPSSYSLLYSPWHPENRRPDQAVPFKNLWQSTQNWTNSWKCLACKLANAENQPTNPGNRCRGTKPGSHWETDFTEVKLDIYGYRYLLVFVDTFLCWIELFPTKKEVASTVVKKIINELIPRYECTSIFRSDNGAAFLFKVTQHVVKILGTNLKLHCARYPQVPDK